MSVLTTVLAKIYSDLQPNIILANKGLLGVLEEAFMESLANLENGIVNATLDEFRELTNNFIERIEKLLHTKQ